MQRIGPLVITLALLLALGAAATAASAAARPPHTLAQAAQDQVAPVRGGVTEPGINATGEGEARATPDVAYLTVGVQAQAQQADAALRDNATRMKAVLDALSGFGLGPNDVQTFGLSIQPMQEQPRPGGTGGPPQVVGYQVTNNVSVTVNDVSKTGQILDAAVGAGANVSGGVRFSLKDPSALRDQALKQALAAAKAQAQSMANALGVGVGPLASVSVEGGAPPRPMGVATAAASADGTPISAGQLSVHVSVRVVYAIA